MKMTNTVATDALALNGARVTTATLLTQDNYFLNLLFASMIWHKVLQHFLPRHRLKVSGAKLYLTWGFYNEGTSDEAEKLLDLWTVGSHKINRQHAGIRSDIMLKCIVLH